MRKILSTLTLMLALVVAMSSCQKGEVVQDVNSLGTGSYVTLTKAGNLNVDATNLAATVSIEVAEYGSPQEKIIMYVTKGNTNAPNDRCHTFVFIKILLHNNFLHRMELLQHLLIVF